MEAAETRQQERRKKLPGITRAIHVYPVVKMEDIPHTCQEKSDCHTRRQHHRSCAAGSPQCNRGGVRGGGGYPPPPTEKPGKNCASINPHVTPLFAQDTRRGSRKKRTRNVSSPDRGERRSHETVYVPEAHVRTHTSRFRGRPKRIRGGEHRKGNNATRSDVVSRMMIDWSRDMPPQTTAPTMRCCPELS